MRKHDSSFSIATNTAVGALAGAYAGFSLTTAFTFLTRAFSQNTTPYEGEARGVAAGTLLLLATGALTGAMIKPTQFRIIKRHSDDENHNYSCYARVFRAATTGIIFAGLIEAALTLFVYAVTGKFVQTLGNEGALSAILFPSIFGAFSAILQACNDHSSSRNAYTPV